MTFATAWTDLRTVLEAVDVGDPTIENPHYWGNEKEASMRNAGKGEGSETIEGAFIMRAVQAPQQWPAVSTVRRIYWVLVEVEIVTLIGTSEFEATKAAEARLRAMYNAVCIDRLIDDESQVYESEIPKLVRDQNDKRLVHFWRFKLRYIE